MGNPVETRLTLRSISHLLVVGLLAVTVASTVRLTPVVHGTVVVELDIKTQYRLIPDPEAPDPWLERRALAFLPEPTPLPTPVAPPAPPPVPRPRFVKPVPIVGTGQLAWPVASSKITQYYGSFHLGIDISAPTGNSVFASAGGVVIWSGWKSNGGGMVVVIDHGNGIVTTYNHLGSLWVSAGETVTVGQGIAGVGCTGTCTGPHVMFSVIVNGVLVNPLRYL